MSFIDTLFRTRDLFLLTAAGARTIHLGFISKRRAVFFFTDSEKAQAYARIKRLDCQVSKLNWRYFPVIVRELVASHIRQAAIDPDPHDEESALVLALQEIDPLNERIWRKVT
ncbi:MAG: hypothetical protein HY692_05270 [Cyanobacteria bacterium NC_groundwater_1444_Ag_S-0.65um_54_12]|nr:hypothetical protein [Cyanobacteria bacterium NC_groundwater_1444_Ag_S-0.65um_54_12]